MLHPISDVWGWLAQRRVERATPYRAHVPVICVGNFTAGGTGKTPLAIRIANDLVSLGETPAFLTRGYRAKGGAPRWVDAKADTAETSGDEPLLLARAARVLIARDRAAGARAIEQADPPASVIIMDDGLQNPSLGKDFSLAVVDGVRGIGNGMVIPSGPLRSPLGFQLGLIDAVVVNGPPAATADGVLTALRRSFPGPVLAARTEPAESTEWLDGARVVAYAGIANPQRFFSLLESCGATVVVRRSFSDHHAFSPADAAALLQTAAAHSASLVTTEKDWVRLSGHADARRDLQARTRTLPICLAFDARDEERFSGLIKSVLSRK